LFGSRVMRPGLFGYDVSVLQFLLTRHGMYDGPLDGYMSRATDKALRRYQRQVHLVSDGVVGPKTVAALVLQNKLPVRPERVSVSLSLSPTYVVRPGDSLTAIAQRFHVPLRTLARTNRLNSKRVLLIGTKLRVPGYTRAACHYALC